MGIQNFHSLAVRKFSELKPHSTFLTVHNYTCVENKKVADWSIVFHISYHNALRRSINTLQSLSLSPLDCIGRGYSYTTLLQARAEMLISYDLSLRGMNYSPSADSYDQVMDYNGNIIPGVKLHREQDLLHLYGFVVHSRIISPPVLKHTEHLPLTLAKMDLERKTPLCRWVQFRLEGGRFDKLVVDHLTIADYEVIRQHAL